MKKIELKVWNKSIRSFSSYRQLIVYTIDLLIKSSIIFLFAFLGVTHIFFSVYSKELSGYLMLYVVSIFIWGLLFIKLIIGGKGTFGKTKFDLFFMGLLSLSLVSVVFSEERLGGVFGTSGTWSYSVITFLGIVILYYVLAQIFKYPRGVKWLGIAFVLSLLIGGGYHVVQIISKNYSINYSYIEYAAASIPVLVAFILLFRKYAIKGISVLALLLNLFLIGYFIEYLQGVLFSLSLSILMLFLIYYLSFWINNNKVIIDTIRELLKGFGTKTSLVKVVGKRRRELFLLALILFIAGWIIGLAYYCYGFYVESIAPYISSWYEEGLGKMSGLKMWLIGENNLTETFSSIEIVNILGNYGVFTTALILGLMLLGIFLSAKFTLEVFRKRSFGMVMLSASIFISIFFLFIVFFLSQYSPIFHLFLVFIFSLYAVLEGLQKNLGLHHLEEFKEKLDTKAIIVKVLLSLSILLITGIGIFGVLSGVEKGFFD